MGIFIFLTAVVAEVAFAARCISTKSDQAKLKNTVRIGALAGFLLLAALQIIEWGASYYLLGAVLLSLAVVGAVSLIRKRSETRPIRRSRIVLKAFEMTILFFVATLPAITFPAHATMPTTGQYPVATASYTYTDQSRIETYTKTGDRRKLNVRIWYPGR